MLRDLKKKLKESQKEISELKEAYSRLQKQFESVKQHTDQSAIEKATDSCLRFLEVYATKSQLENIVTWKSLDEGERLNEEDPHPTCILTPKYPKIRVDLRIKLQIEAEAKNTKNGNSKNATHLFRLFIQNIFTDNSFWCKNSQKAIYKEHTELIDAIIS